MNSMEKYIAKMLFGNVKGLKFNKKNLLYVKENYIKYNLYDAGLNLSIIELNNNYIEFGYCFDKERKRYKLSYEDFWNKSKHLTKICIIEKSHNAIISAIDSLDIISKDKVLEKEWKSLEDVFFSEDEEKELILGEDWFIFDKGTAREDIWKYFDKNHSKGIYYLLYEYEAQCCDEEDEESL